MAKLKRWLKKAWQERGYTLSSFGAAMRKRGATSACDKARVSSWFGNEGIPEDILLLALEELGINPLEVVWRMDEDDVRRYTRVLMDDEEVAAALLDLFAQTEEVWASRIATPGRSASRKGKTSRAGRAKG